MTVAPQTYRMDDALARLTLSECLELLAFDARFTGTAGHAREGALKAPVQFYELDAVQRIVDGQPTSAHRALLAFLYGSTTEVSVAVKLTR